VAAIPTEKEKREVAFYLGLREQIHEGPLYTAPQARDAKPTKVYGEDQFNNQFHNKLKPDIDPFEGMPLYSWKYDQEKRALPELSARSFGKSPPLNYF
jgi:DNA-directed RNA polymerase III subunit RPC7